MVKNPVRATLLLILSFLPTSIIYILLQAGFVGILQILVYAGAIMMLFTFVIMMINPSPKGGESTVTGGEANKSGFGSVLIALILLAGLGALILPKVYHAASQVSTSPITKPDFGELSSISMLIFKDPNNNPFTVSFELISFLILVGIIAALNFSRRKVPLPAGGSQPSSSEMAFNTRPTEALPLVKSEATQPKNSTSENPPT